MKKDVHIGARGPPTVFRNEGTEKHSTLFQWASLRRQGKPSLFKKGFEPRFKVQATTNACSPARVSFPGRNFSQQISFRRKEKKNVTLLLWYCGKCWRRCGEIAPAGVVVVVEAPRGKRSARSTSGDDDNSSRWAFRPGKAQYYCPSSSSSSSCSSNSWPHRSSTQQLILSSVSASCNNQEAKIYYRSIIKMLGSVQIYFYFYFFKIVRKVGGWVGDHLSGFFFSWLFSIY
jgi:hypothetical protein